MKGYYTENGFMGYVDGRYMLFADESDYEEFLRPGRRQKRRAVFGNSSAAAFRDGISACAGSEQHLSNATGAVFCCD